MRLLLKLLQLLELLTQFIVLPPHVVLVLPSGGEEVVPGSVPRVGAVRPVAGGRWRLWHHQRLLTLFFVFLLFLFVVIEQIRLAERASGRPLYQPLADALNVRVKGNGRTGAVCE